MVMKTFKLLLTLITAITISSCVSMKEPTITKSQLLEGYKYAYLPQAGGVSSESGDVYKGNYSMSGYPGDVISGVLLKSGFIMLPQLKEELLDETVIVNYGQSGKRQVANGVLGRTLEVTIKLVSASDYKEIYACTAEGKGATEADEIRVAITRCLMGMGVEIER